LRKFELNDGIDYRRENIAAIALIARRGVGRRPISMLGFAGEPWVSRPRLTPAWDSFEVSL
jgi:hypothetical protein